MERTLLLDRENGKACAALLENGRLVQFVQDGDEPAPGSVYLGRVQRVLEGLDGAFMDIGLGKNGIISGSNDLPKGENGETLIKQGMELPVQVIKTPGGDKGAQLSANIRLAGRNAVVLPNSRNLGVSRRVSDGSERARLRKLGESLRPAGMGLILRSQAAGASPEELARETDALASVWKGIETKARHIKAPALLLDGSRAAAVAARDMRLDAETRIIARDQALLDDLLGRSEGGLPCRISVEDSDLLTVYRVRAQLDTAKKRRVDLKCGGYLVFDDTEAMRVIDVNSGSFTGKDAEDTAYRLNLEAADEIAVQARLRNLVGIIVIDFVDMREKAHRESVVERLTRAFVPDTGRVAINPLSALGLCEMTRQSRYAAASCGEE